MFPYFSFLFAYEESHIEEKSREIKEKDQAIASKEHIIKEKSGNIVSLETEIASLQVSGSILYENSYNILLSCNYWIKFMLYLCTYKSLMFTFLKKGKVDAAEQAGKAHVKAVELEKEVKKLRKDIDVKIKEKERLEARATEAEKKASELSTKFESVSNSFLLVIRVSLWCELSSFYYI